MTGLATGMLTERMSWINSGDFGDNVCLLGCVILVAALELRA